MDTDSLEYPETISAHARDFMQKLIRKNPDERMSAEEALNHVFLMIEDDS